MSFCSERMLSLRVLRFLLCWMEAFVLRMSEKMEVRKMSIWKKRGIFHMNIEIFLDRTRA